MILLIPWIVRNLKHALWGYGISHWRKCANVQPLATENRARTATFKLNWSSDSQSQLPIFTPTRPKGHSIKGNLSMYNDWVQVTLASWLYVKKHRKYYRKQNCDQMEYDISLWEITIYKYLVANNPIYDLDLSQSHYNYPLCQWHPNGNKIHLMVILSTNILHRAWEHCMCMEICSTIHLKACDQKTPYCYIPKEEHSITRYKLFLIHKWAPSSCEQMSSWLTYKKTQIFEYYWRINY